MGMLATLDQAVEIAPLEAALMDVARALQLTKTQHKQAEDHYNGLASQVDHGESPLKDKVPDIYPSGSFAIHAAVRSSISRNQHDVDAVVELDIPTDSDPEWVLDTLYDAIKGKPGSRYYNYNIERNSRCITVIYDDGVKVDLMPVVRIPNMPDRVAELFHHKPETGESYRKEINPKGFADYFNLHVEVNASFTERFASRRLLVEGKTFDGVIAETADAAPMPAYLPLDQKSPRVVALQLLKRFRDKRYRKLDDHQGRRKPPSVAMAALALKAGTVGDSLFGEIVKVSSYIRSEIIRFEQAGRRIEVSNPAHIPDLFTDRWPKDRLDQQLWAKDLKHLTDELERLSRIGFDAKTASTILTDLFGESAAKIAVEKHYTAEAKLLERGRLGVTSSGQVRPIAKPVAPSIISGATVGASLISPARANTNMGGIIDDADY